MRSQRSFSVDDIMQGTNPVLSIMVAALLVILGVLVIVYPEVLQWVAGVGLILAGVGLVASIFTSSS